MSKAVAVVTGATGGMGRAVAERLADDQDVILVDVDQGKLDDLAARLSGEARSVCGDLADPATADAIAAAVGDRPLGPVVHTAGLSPSMADGRRILDVNLAGTAYLSRALRPLCTSGSVMVVVASMAGHMADLSAMAPLFDDPLADGAIAKLAEGASPAYAYAVSKYGVLHHVRASARAWGERGGRIVSVSPGLIETPMGLAELAGAPVLRQAVDAQPVPRMGRPDEIAEAILFLASDKASFITGTDLLVDGGAIALQRADPAIAKSLAG